MKHSVLKRLLPMPFKAEHIQYSVVASLYDDTPAPDTLVEIGLNAAAIARKTRLDGLSARMKGLSFDANVWPGEHYRLLVGLVSFLKPRRIIEIGTYTGISALAMKETLPVDGRIDTYDLCPWKTLPNTSLTEDDFADGRLVQHVDDLTNWTVFQKHLPVIEEADMLFVDAAKDGICEIKLLENFERAHFKKSPLMVFDDIRLWNMLAIWRGIQRPKLDLTSLGHYTGTGLVEWV